MNQRQKTLVDSNVIPEMVHPLSRHWKQPKVSDILLDSQVALMSQETLDLLSEYSMSVPTGVYTGKMWKMEMRATWWLRWMVIEEGESEGVILSRRILVVK